MKKHLYIKGIYRYLNNVKKQVKINVYILFIYTVFYMLFYDNMYMQCSFSLEEGLTNESINSILYSIMAKHNIKELYEEPEELIDVIVPLLKGRVSIDEGTKEPFLATDLLTEKSRIVILLYMLGKKAVFFSFSDLDPDRYGASAKGVAESLCMSKGQADGAFNTLKQEGIIEVFHRGKRKEVFYNIPNRRVLQAVKIIEDVLMVPF